MYTADVASAPDSPEAVFSRSSVKECALEGAPADPNTKAHFELE